MTDYLILAGQGHFFTGLREHTGPAGTSVYGMHVEWQAPPAVRANLVLVHGGGGQALDMLSTPDGREGWATLFLRAGFAVYAVDRPGMGRSPYHQDIYGPPGAPPTYGSFVASFAGPSPDGHPAHTQWPGDGTRDDPALAQFLAGQEPFPGSLAAAHEAMRAGAAALLDRIGPSVLLTHSLGGAFGWLAASERRDRVQAIVAVEPAGAPFSAHPVLGDFTYGLTAVPVSFGPGAGDAKLDGLPVAIVTAECSPFGASCDATAGYLRECGADVTDLRLAEHGLHGNGHAMMLERNNAGIAALITDWIRKQL
jgi:pimeloyl-ACP methyl ester carboxylesterase